MFFSALVLWSPLAPCRSDQASGVKQLNTTETLVTSIKPRSPKGLISIPFGWRSLPFSGIRTVGGFLCISTHEPQPQGERVSNCHGGAPGVTGVAWLTPQAGHCPFLLPSPALPPAPPLSVPVCTKARPQVVPPQCPIFFIVPDWNL